MTILYLKIVPKKKDEYYECKKSVKGMSRKFR